MRAWPLLVSCSVLACAADPPADPGIPTPAINTPRWAFEPWISKDISDGADTYDFVQGFIDRDIPVGAVVIDSPWETDYNPFTPNPDRYPNFAQLVTDMHARGVKVVLWTTQMINEDSFDLEAGGDSYDSPSVEYLIAQDRGYLVNEGATYRWWKGVGAAIDFFNPDAVAWWHGLQDRVLDLGIDGWKLDFGESYITTPVIRTAAGDVAHQAYSEEYYRDFWAYGVHKRGPDFLTMVRPYDKSYQFEGRFFARREHAPVGWVGDNRRDWIGLHDALDHIFRSAKAGYVTIGSDVGGYLDRDDGDLTQLVPADVEVFMRWTAMGAMTPFMQLHGRANLTPWTVHERASEVVAAYRYWATLHHELVPFFDNLARRAHQKTLPIIEPLGDEATWAADYRFITGDTFFVAPILDASGRRDVLLPPGERWIDWFRPGEDALEGGTTLTNYDPGASARIPLFVREGAIIPMVVSSTITGLADVRPVAPRQTVLFYPSARTSFFTRYDSGEELVIEGTLNGLTFSRLETATQAWIRVDAPVTEVFVNGQVARFTYDAAKRWLVVALERTASAREVAWR